MDNHSKMRELELERDVATTILQLMDGETKLVDLMRQIAVTLKKYSACEAIGIRLREGMDYPYYQTNGFPDKFVKMEKYLCPRKKNGKVEVDENGDPILECMCGNIICGRTDSTQPFFTENGSFWSNNTGELLASTTDEDRGAHTRNRCNGEGYESVALIPLRSQEKTLGLLQFNDSRTDRFTESKVAFFEQAANIIALGLSRKQAEEELITKERLATLGHLTATVSHEIRNPLGTIRTAIFSINDALDRNQFGRISRALKLAERNVIRCDNIIDELLCYSRRNEVEPEPVHIDSWLGATLDAQAVEDSIDCFRELNADLVIPIDTGKMRRAVTNIYVNAVHALQEKQTDSKRLTVASLINGGNLEIRIIDNGVGMEPSVFDNMFEPLFSTKGFGVGLGLPIVKNIMNQHGGDIEIESDYGKGTTVILWLPISKPKGN